MIRRLLALLLVHSALLGASSVWAAVRLPGVFGNGMILQRDASLMVWGWADPGEAVVVSFRGKQYAAVTSEDGRWRVRMEPQHAGGPDRMEIVGENRVTVDDVLVGDVWVCSGQSNMTHQFNRWSERYAAEIAAADVPEIRQLHAPTRAVLSGPEDDVPGLAWTEATPERVLEFSVIGYFFARKLYGNYKVPQGIILSCVGGTRIEAWTSEAGFRGFPEMLDTIQRNKDPASIERINAAASVRARDDAVRGDADKGRRGAIPWSDPAYMPRRWKPINIPGFWEDQGVRDLDGVVWYRREIEIPESMAGAAARLRLGRIRDADEVFVNGTLVGSTTYEYPQRRYTIPAGVLKPGRNLLVVRVTNHSGKGGFIPDKPYQIEAAGHAVDLKGTWHYRVGAVFTPRPPRNEALLAQDQPAALFNGMIAPFTDFAVRGVLWYQGESNADDPAAYRALLPNMIRDWRRQWGNDDLVFLVAQLPNYMDVDHLPAGSNWALMREVQLDTARTVPRTGLGINIDLGEWNDIHPGNKKPVGERLALQAMKIAYGEKDLVASGPLFRSQEIRGGRIVLTFDSIGGGLVSSDGEPLAHFAIAGEDGRFTWAEAAIEDDTVVVWSDAVPEPRYVRYAWADNPDFANLANREGLPASPFRTDRWSNPGPIDLRKTE